MTTQTSDRFIYRGEHHSLEGIQGRKLFDPEDHGFKPVEISTGCRRGFHCTYEVTTTELLLREVYLGLGERDTAAALAGKGGKLFGQLPKRYTECGRRINLSTREVTTSWESSEFRVDQLSEPVSFTGGLLLCDDFMWEMREVGDYSSYPYMWRVAHELVFENGRLVEEHDRSSEMTEYRDMLSAMKDFEKRSFRFPFVIGGLS